MNDVADRDADRRHPTKRFRPIASGAVQPSTALGFAACSDRGRARRGLAAAAGVRRDGAVAYVGLLALYSGPLKHVVILDVLTIAIGFVLRAVAGAVAIDVPISHWLLSARFSGRCSWRWQAAARAGAAGRRRHEPSAAFWRSTARICSIR